MGKVYKTTQKVIVDSSTGEIIREENTSSFRTKEPAYIKTYVDDLIKIIRIPDRNKNVLLSMLKYVDYGNNIDISIRIKNEMANELHCGIGNINNAISALKKAGILISTYRSCYFLNPDYFAKGDWAAVNKIRTTIEYSKDGKKIISDFLEDK